MTFDEVLAQMIELLQREGRVTYRALKRRFALDDDYLADLTAEIIDAKRLAIDEDEKVLIWKGSLASSVQSLESEFQKNQKAKVAPPQRLTPSTQHPSAERRQLTVLFCDLVGSTALSEQLDPEDYHAVVQAYHQTCDAVIQRYDGFVPQHLGDGLLVYFGYPIAHEDDAQRAVRAALEIIQALQSRARQQAARAPLPHGRGSDALPVRIGIHTGLVVIGEIGSGEKRELLALGETPNLAARLQGLAGPDTVVISAATQHLVPGLFECQDLGPQELKGLSTPVSVYRVVGEGAAQSRFEAIVNAGLTPLVGRGEELSVLHQRWAQAKAGSGQVVLLNGESGIGKSRLVQELKERVNAEGATRIEFHCSPYHQNGALYPIIDHLQRLLQFAREDTPTTKLEKLQLTLSRYHFPQADTFPLLAVLLSLPYPEGCSPITLSPQKQKEKTQAALVAWLIEEAEQRPVYTVWEDLHWADPSTLEVLTLFLDQAPTARLLTILTSRPEFTSPWGSRSYFTQLMLNRLGRSQAWEMVRCVSGQMLRPSTSSGRTELESDLENLPVRAEPVEAQAALSDVLIEAVVAKTDGVPLFVEELTKTVVETVGERATGIGERSNLSSVQLGVPSTLQDALMARLDRLGPAKEIAQLGATLGREFSYELLHVVANQDESSLQQGLKQLVAAELVYQRGLLPQATYLFKHALIQDTAYQSLLKSRRQQLHQQIAQVLEAQFSDTKEAQPELLAHHYTEAGLAEQAIPYWQKAGERATQRSANVEAIRYFTTGLGLLKTLPDTPKHAQQEIALQLTLGNALMIIKGWGSLETGNAYARARELCQQVGETPQIFPVMLGLRVFYTVRGELQTARKLGEQMLRLAQSVQDPAFFLPAHYSLGVPLFWLGEFNLARAHFEQGLAAYHSQYHSSQALPSVHPEVTFHSQIAWVLWYLGYPDQALRRMNEAFTLAHKLSHPYSLVFVLSAAAPFHEFRREGQTAQERAETMMELSTEHGFTHLLALGIAHRGVALIQQGQIEEGIKQVHQGLADWQATGAEYARSYFLALLAEAYGRVGHTHDGLSTLAEALVAVEKTGGYFYEAELYRLKGELTLQQKSQKANGKGQKSKIETDAQGEAEACFLKAIEIAQKQQAKSLELRAAMSLARLWQQQGKKAEAHDLLSNVYNWFTEGFDTKDLQEAKMLLDELS